MTTLTELPGAQTVVMENVGWDTYECLLFIPQLAQRLQLLIDTPEG